MNNSKKRVEESAETMAFQMTHLEIAYRLAKRLGITKGREEFILGSVAPDAISEEVPYIPTKIHTHLFEECGPWGDTQDYDRWLVNIRAFWDENGRDETDIKKKMLKLGICVHCMTDYWNDLLIWRALQKEYMPPMTVEEFRSEYYPEARVVDKWLFQNSENSEEIFKLFAASETMDIGDYSYAKDQEDIRDHLTNVQYNLPEPLDVSKFKYYPSEKIIWFVATATDRIEGMLRDYYL